MALGTDPRKWDTDGDGLSDGLVPEVMECKPPSTNALGGGGQTYDPPPTADDWDGDGVPNWAERIAGTDPNDSNVYLRITNIAKTTAGRMIWWDGVEDRQYRVEGLSGGTGLVAYTWAPVETQWLAGVDGGMSYTDTTAAVTSQFYHLGVWATDSDGDGMPDWWEKLYGGLNISSNDAANDLDGDGYSNLQEYEQDSDPTDYWSVPLSRLQFLTVQGKYLVDEDTNRVVLKCVNIGGWLAFDQELTAFAPTSFVSALGRPHTNVMDDATLRELLVDNVDFATNLIAVNCSAAQGVTTSAVQTAESGSWTVGCISSYAPPDWVCFSDVAFDGCVSNVSVILGSGGGVAGYNAKIDVRQGSHDGPQCGVLEIKDSGDHDALVEQHAVLTSGLSGTQTIFFVASNSIAATVGQLYRFRFYRDTNTTNLLERFRDGYFTSSDLDRIKELGYNCVRVPFLSTLVQDYTGTNYLEEGRNRLDWLISECTRHRIWCILDLHGAPGGQNRATDSGRAEGLRNRLWGGELYKNNLVHLWKTIAGWYQTNSAVAGYDVFNEPDPPGAEWKIVLYTSNVLPMLKRLYSGIRSNDTNHVIIMESNFRDMGANFWNAIWQCPDPASNGWTNIVYEFHHYDHTEAWTNDSDDVGFEAQKVVADDIVRNYVRFSEDRQVPVFIGEFMPVEMPNFDYFIRQFEGNGLSWAHWNYRHWGWDDSNRPWSSWGLDYRTNGVYGAVNTDIQPDVMADSFETLSDKLAGYTRTNYLANEHLCEVVVNTTLNTSSARERTEFYANAFSSPDRFAVGNAWPWRKVATVGPTSKFWVVDGRAQLRLDAGPLLIRLKTRHEAEARFNVVDDEGSSVSMDLMNLDVTKTNAGCEAEFRLAFTRDAVTTGFCHHPSPAVAAVCGYDLAAASTTLWIWLYAKTGGVDTCGGLLTNGTVSFTTGATLRLHLNATQASVDYGGSTISAPHGLSLSNWVGGAIAVIEAEDKATGGVAYLEMDSVRAWRQDAETVVEHTNEFATYPAGIPALAETENLTVRMWDPTNAWLNSYITNQAMHCIPEQVTEGWTFLNPRRDYQNDLRLNLTATNVVEVRAAYSNFSEGTAKICLVPECFPGQILYEYEGQALYVQLSRSDTNLEIAAYRHFGTGLGNRSNIATVARGYVGGRAVTLQVSTNALQGYYGTDFVLDALHGLTDCTTAFEDGVYFHYEFQNTETTTGATVEIDGVRCRSLSAFAAPPE